jgi:hypothetical protein
VITTAVVLVALWPLRIAAYQLLRRFHVEDRRLLVELPAGTPPGGVIDAILDSGVRLSALSVAQEGDRRVLELDVVLPRDVAAPRLVARVADVPEVADVRWD